jgi:hypothetical protein
MFSQIMTKDENPEFYRNMTRLYNKINKIGLNYLKKKVAQATL